MEERCYTNTYEQGPEETDVSYGELLRRFLVDLLQQGNQ